MIKAQCKLHKYGITCRHIEQQLRSTTPRLRGGSAPSASTLEKENNLTLISSNDFWWAILPYGFENKSMNSNFIEINLAASIGF